MSEQYASLEQHKNLEKKVEDGFNRVNKSIEDLSTGTQKSIQQIADSLATVTTKSLQGDYNVKDKVIQEVDRREEVKKNYTMRIIGISVPLFLALIGALFTSIRKDIEVKALKEENTFLKAYHEQELRIQKLETNAYWCDKMKTK